MARQSPRNQLKAPAKKIVLPKDKAPTKAAVKSSNREFAKYSAAVAATPKGKQLPKPPSTLTISSKKK